MNINSINTLNFSANNQNKAALNEKKPAFKAIYQDQYITEVVLPNSDYEHMQLHRDALQQFDKISKRKKVNVFIRETKDGDGFFVGATRPKVSGSKSIFEKRFQSFNEMQREFQHTIDDLKDRIKYLETGEKQNRKAHNQQKRAENAYKSRERAVIAQRRQLERSIDGYRPKKDPNNGPKPDKASKPPSFGMALTQEGHVPQLAKKTFKTNRELQEYRDTIKAYHDFTEEKQMDMTIRPVSNNPNDDTVEVKFYSQMFPEYESDIPPVQGPFVKMAQALDVYQNDNFNRIATESARYSTYNDILYILQNQKPIK